MRLTGAATGRELLACLLREWRRFGGDANSSFRRGMREWTQQIMLGFGASSVELPSFEELERATEDDRMEYLLEDHIREWRAELHREGIAQGVEQGIAQGIAQGVEQGIAQGVEQGIAQGERNALERLAGRRFGAGAARRLSAALNGAPSRQRLDELGDLIVLCRTTEEFVGKLDG